MKGNDKKDITEGKILVVGLGISGVVTASWLAKAGAHVDVSEIRPEKDLDPAICRELRELGVGLETGGHCEHTFLNADTIIVSPGVPHNTTLLHKARERGSLVIGELEFASRLINTPMIAVTGTNGKSTVTTFLGRMLKTAGYDVFVGGNIGTPLMAYVTEDRQADYAVIEVSSFQLDTVETFCPHISLILNISPDHLDRYPSYEAYVESKLRVFMNQGSDQHVIINDDDERLAEVHPSSGVSVIRYGLKKKKGRHAFIEQKTLMVCLDGEEIAVFPLDSFNLPGNHNLGNLMATVLAGKVLGINPTIIQKSIGQFQALPNRVERVGELDGVVFYNDSKATNVDAAVNGIMSFNRPLILIAGGRHKGGDYGPLVLAAKRRVKKAIFIGEAKDLLATSFKGVLPFSTAKDMTEAVTMGFSWAEKGDAILLAPACSSFDMFSDYSHRGVVFRSAVERLIANDR